MQESADNLEFSAERFSENAKTIKLGFERWSHLCPSTYENNQPLYQLLINTCVSQDHSEKNAFKRHMPFICQKSLNLNDLHTFVAKFCRGNLRTFSADFFGLKSRIRRLYPFLDV